MTTAAAVIHRLKSEAVLILAALAAVLSMLLTPPSTAYIGYIDVRVLCLLFCLMAVVAGLQACGVFGVLAQRMLCGSRRFSLISLTLVLLPFFLSMLITNDVSLIAFVPFTVTVLLMCNRQRDLIYIVVLQTLAANLGSMATPIGNPQNLYLFSRYSISPRQFVQSLLPFVLLSLIGLCFAVLAVGRQTVSVYFPEKAEISSYRLLWVCIVLLLLCVLSVFRALHYGILLLLVLAAFGICAPRLLKKVDYCLLLTFVCFFIFAGNIGASPQIGQFLSRLIGKNTVLPSVLTSQLISNVPAAVLLSAFSRDGAGLLIGTNIGGLGTLIASLASLISFRLYMKTPGASALRYLMVFTAANILGLTVLLLAARLLGMC